MKIVHLIPSLLLLICSLILTDCRRKANDEPKPPTKTELLTSHPWRVKDNSITTVPPIEIPADFIPLYNSITAVFTDSEFTFNTGGVLTVRSKSTNQTTTGTWVLNEANNRTELTIEFQSQQWTFNILTLTQDQIIGQTGYTVTISGFPVPLTIQMEMIPV
jgi:hypothetical protein